MPVYKCSFQSNKRVKKIRVAKNRTECILALNYEGVLNPKVREVADLHGLEYVLLGDTSLNKIKKAVLCDFLEQLSFLLKAGLPLYQCLESLGRSGDKFIKHLCVKIVPSIIEGKAFNEALKSTGMFEAEVIHQIRAGEESGDLPRSLDRVVDSYRKQMSLKSKTATAAVYPAFMLVIMIAVVFLMVNFLIPTIAKSFSDLGGELPAITQFVVNTSSWIASHTPKAVITVILIVLIIKTLKKKSLGFKERYDKLLLKIPLLGDLRYKQEIASLCLILSSLITCGIPIVQSLQIASETMKNEYLKRKLLRAKRYVEVDGSSLYAALVQVKAFPVLMTQLVDVGERSGDVSAVLEKLAERYEYFVENVTKRMITLMEPTIIVLMVIVGGTVVIGMMMPIFTIIEII